MHQKGSMTNKMHQIHFRPGFRPGPCWGAHPDPLVGWRVVGIPPPHSLPPRCLRRLVLGTFSTSSWAPCHFNHWEQWTCARLILKWGTRMPSVPNTVVPNTLYCWVAIIISFDTIAVSHHACALWERLNRTEFNFGWRSSEAAALPGPQLALESRFTAAGRKGVSCKDGREKRGKQCGERKRWEWSPLF